MSALISGYATLEKLEQIVETLKEKKLKGFDFTVSVNDETNKEYGTNVTFYAKQSKEQIASKSAKFFWGNGKIFWTDGKITVAEKKEGAGGSPSLKDSYQPDQPPAKKQEVPTNKKQTGVPVPDTTGAMDDLPF